MATVIFTLDSFSRFKNVILGKSGDLTENNPYAPVRKAALTAVKKNTEAVFKIVKVISKRSQQQMIITEETFMLNKPGFNASIIKILMKGSCVTIRGSINNYFYVSENGVEGWIPKHL